MKLRFEVTADVVEIIIQTGVDLTADEIDELSKEIEMVIGDYFKKNPWATIKVNQMSLINVEVSGDKFAALDFLEKGTKDDESTL